MAKTTMIKVEVLNVVLSEKGFVVLKNDKDERVLPIFIDKGQAESILIALSDAKPARPLTHDLMNTIITSLGAAVKRVEIVALVNETFIGSVVLDRNQNEIAIDARPSDAISLAIRAQVPIFVADHVMDEAGVIVQDPSTHVAEEVETTAPMEQDLLHTSDTEMPESSEDDMSQLETLKRQLNTAISQERYEEAARLRDEIARQSPAN